MTEFEQQYAYILHSRPYRETSALVTFFSARKGKFNAIVRGVRGPKAKKKSVLIQPFQRLEIRWKTNYCSDLVQLQALEFSQLNFPLSSTANLCGLYANELLYRLLFAQMEMPAIFAVYEQLLYELLQSQQFVKPEQQPKIEWALRRFELFLLSELVDGFSLENIDELAPDKAYQFVPDWGWRMQHSNSRLAILGSHLQSLRDDVFCTEALASLKRLMRQQVQLLLGNKPLHARKLFS